MLFRGVHIGSSSHLAWPNFPLKSTKVALSRCSGAALVAEGISQMIWQHGSLMSSFSHWTWSPACYSSSARILLPQDLQDTCENTHKPLCHFFSVQCSAFYSDDDLCPLNYFPVDAFSADALYSSSSHSLFRCSRCYSVVLRVLSTLVQFCLVSYTHVSRLQSRFMVCRFTYERPVYLALIGRLVTLLSCESPEDLFRLAVVHVSSLCSIYQVPLS